MDIEQIQSDARENFSLRDRLATGGRRTKTVTIYTDANAGAKLGFAEDGTYTRERAGLLGELDEIRTDIQQRLKFTDENDEDAIAALKAELAERTGALREQITELRDELNKTAFIFTLQSLPNVIVRSLRRKARQALGIKGKDIPEDMQEDYALEHTAQFVAASVVEMTDNLTGVTHKGFTVEQAHELLDFLPPGQFDVLDNAIMNLSIERTVGKASTDDLDF